MELYIFNLESYLNSITGNVKCPITDLRMGAELRFCLKISNNASQKIKKNVWCLFLNRFLPVLSESEGKSPCARASGHWTTMATTVEKNQRRQRRKVRHVSRGAGGLPGDSSGIFPDHRRSAIRRGTEWKGPTISIFKIFNTNCLVCYLF